MKPTPIELEMPMGKDINGVEHREPWKAYDIDEVDSILAEKDKEIAELKQKLESVQASMYADVVDANMDNRRLKRALWLMTAEWADAMGLASCNIAIKLSFKERFFYHDEANREKDIKKYNHRKVVFYKMRIIAERRRLLGNPRWQKKRYCARKRSL